MILKRIRSWLAIFLMMVIILSFKPIKSNWSLNPGCITTQSFEDSFNTTPPTIYATVATGGTCSNYSYQWQISTDNIYFSDIPGATGQNLTYTSPLTATTYFQRKTTCGSQVAYTMSITVTMRYYNVLTSGPFTRNNCTNGGEGGTVTYSIPAYTYSSTTSQAAANQLATNALNANGQSYANSNAPCIWYSDRIFGYYYKEECGEGQVPVPYFVDIPAGEYSSTISKADANAQAQLGAQELADKNGDCIESCCSAPEQLMGYKCITTEEGDQCEQGVKVYTDCYEESEGVWIWVFHYEFSDSSWSDDYYELHEQDCEL